MKRLTHFSLGVVLVPVLISCAGQNTPKEVVVPQYIGLNQTKAKQTLINSGLTMMVAREIYDPNLAPGIIVNGDPAPGLKVRMGRTIVVTVSRNKHN